MTNFNIVLAILDDTPTELQMVQPYLDSAAKCELTTEVMIGAMDRIREDPRLSNKQALIFECLDWDLHLQSD